MRKSLNWLWLISPALILIIALFGGSLFFNIAGSLGFFSPTGNGSFSIDGYTQIGDDREVITAFWFTFVLTCGSTILSAICGVALAVWLRRQMQNSITLRTLLQIPLAVPHLAVSLILLNLLTPSGIFSRIVYQLGLIETPSEFPILVADEYGFGIIAAYVLKETPFIALIVLTVLTRIGNEFEQVAMNLGASVWQRFRFVTLPLIAPSAVFSSLIVWVFVFGAFEIPFILGRTFPTMLSVVAQRKFNATNLAERPEAFALAVLMTIIVMVFVWIYLRSTRNLIEFEKTSIF
ncbi:MAG: ABC transporter permease [Pyrinomonadaceae bacterium]